MGPDWESHFTSLHGRKQKTRGNFKLNGHSVWRSGWSGGICPKSLAASVQTHTRSGRLSWAAGELLRSCRCMAWSLEGPAEVLLWTKQLSSSVSGQLSCVSTILTGSSKLCIISHIIVAIVITRHGCKTFFQPLKAICRCSSVRFLYCTCVCAADSQCHFDVWGLKYSFHSLYQNKCVMLTAWCLSKSSLVHNSTNIHIYDAYIWSQ